MPLFHQVLACAMLRSFCCIPSRLQLLSHKVTSTMRRDKGGVRPLVVLSVLEKAVGTMLEKAVGTQTEK